MMEKAKLPILIGRKPEMIKIAKANKWVIVKDLIEVEKYLK